MYDNKINWINLANADDLKKKKVLKIQTRQASMNGICR